MGQSRSMESDLLGGNTTNVQAATPRNDDENTGKSNDKKITLSEEAKLERVMNTLNKIKQLHGMDDISIDSKVLWARRLALEESLLATYLSQDETIIHDMLVELYGIDGHCANEEMDQIRNRSCTNDDNFRDHYDCQVNSCRKESDPQKREQSLMLAMTNFLKEEISTKTVNRWKGDTRAVKIRLLLEERRANSVIGARRSLCPLMTHPDSYFFSDDTLDDEDNPNTERTIVTSVMVGPWHLEWSPTGIVVPRRCLHLSCKMANDVDVMVLSGPSFPVAIKRLARIVCKWNGGTLDGPSIYDAQTRNAQHFVDELLMEMGVMLRYEGILQQVIHEIREQGSCSDLRVPHGIHFGFDELAFCNHAELDNYIMGVDPTYFGTSNAGQHDWFTLKSYDRIFWTRNLAMQQDVQKSCPCGDLTAAQVTEDVFYEPK